MNYLVISPYYPQNFQQFTIELANKGITVLGIGQEPYEQLDEPLRNSLTEYFRVDNLENIDEVKRAVAFLFYKHGPIDRIECGPWRCYQDGSRCGSSSERNRSSNDCQT